MPKEEPVVRPQSFRRWYSTTEAEAVRVRGLGDGPRGDEPAPDAGAARPDTTADDAGAEAEVVVPSELPEPETAAEPVAKPTRKRASSRRRTPKES